jgi:hypothetical protein
MAKLDSTWWNAFQGSFEDEEDVIEFIFERLDTSDFEDSYIDAGGYGEPNEMYKLTAQDKRNTLYDFMIDLVERKHKNGHNN